MTYPRELVIATGTTVYAGDPESDERIQSREVRVQVTYEIDDDEADVPLLAAVKAAEVEQAHRAVRRRISAAPNSLSPAEAEPFDPATPGLEPPDEPENDDEPEVDDEADCPGAGSGDTASRPAPPWVSPTGSDKAAEETDWATKPQVLAIGSHFKRLGIGPADQTALLRARFGKFRPERLTKDEAAGLMRSLERGEVAQRPVAPVSDADGRHPAAAHA